ncbi:MAG: 3D domain-containing protein [Clostridia bacterium]|nr:3D domain-containing protein [Clostridia bacterium]
MTGFEASDSIQPQRNVRQFKLKRNKAKSSMLPFVIMFVLVGFLCANNYTLLRSYDNLKNDLSETYDQINNERQLKQKIASEANELQQKHKQLQAEYSKVYEEYSTLKENSSKTSRSSDDLYKQLEELKKQNNELTKQYKDLVNDNVALQNSLKMAASVGVKPQSFTAFEGLEPRTAMNRGKYVGKFLGTAYTPSKEECGNDKGITKSGNPIMPGISIAIDNEYWPFGTIFYIKGLGYTVAMDTGSAIKGKYRFDFSVFDKEFAKKLGSRKWEVYLVKLGTGKIKDVKL